MVHTTSASFSKDRVTLGPVRLEKVTCGSCLPDRQPAVYIDEHRLSHHGQLPASTQPVSAAANAARDWTKQPHKAPAVRLLRVLLMCAAAVFAMRAHPSAATRARSAPGGRCCSLCVSADDIRKRCAACNAGFLNANVALSNLYSTAIGT
jgi:hypothetical protein